MAQSDGDGTRLSDDFDVMKVGTHAGAGILGLLFSRIVSWFETKEIRDAVKELAVVHAKVVDLQAEVVKLRERSHAQGNELARLQAKEWLEGSGPHPPPHK
jgi:hypothetical protein